MSLYGRIFAANYARVQARAERAALADMRKRLLGDAHGRVLELGTGPGMNLAYYPDTVEQLVLSEPEAPMVRQLERRLARDSRSAQVVQAAAESLPFDDDSFDAVTAVYVLCTVKDPALAVAEIARVLRPNGRFLFIEHVRARDPGLARWQDRLHGPWLRFGHGCHCNRDTLALLESSALEVGDVERGRVPKVAPLVSPYVLGAARLPHETAARRPESAEPLPSQT